MTEEDGNQGRCSLKQQDNVLFRAYMDVVDGFTLIETGNCRRVLYGAGI